jgi:3-deoxy-D-manno-octulosonate 8-phosphate phosphatase KdsC-like HAD superfamily phosphatase
LILTTEKAKGVTIDGAKYPLKNANLDKNTPSFAISNEVTDNFAMVSIKKGGLFAIGDYYNDVQMLKLADVSAVPCDSPEDIKSLANYITNTCENGAVADFIDYLDKLMQ